MLEVQMTPATVVFVIVIVGLMLLAMRRLIRKGLCDCKKCTGSKDGNGCQGCAAVDKMIAEMEKAAK